MKKTLNFLVIMLLVISLAACGRKTEESKLAAIALPITADEFFVHIGDTLDKAFKDEGYETQMTDAGSDFTLYVQQLETFVTKGADALYIFAAGEPDLYEDVIKKANEKGIKTIVSHNVYPFEDATINIMADEFTMGVMMAPMVTKYLDRVYPNAEPKSVKALALETSMLPEMVRRSAGMKIIGQKYLREVDMLSGKYEVSEGPKVNYKDLDGNIKEVDEPTGGLILDGDGNAMLNPFYDERINVIEIANRDHQTNLNAQESLDNFATAPANKDLRIILNYGGDAAAGASEKMMELFNKGSLDAEVLDQLAVFGADITDTNIERILSSNNNESLVRGVMTNGNIVETINKYAQMIAKGEEVPNESYEKVGFAILDDNGTEVYQGLYEDELPDVELFFPN